MAMDSIILSSLYTPSGQVKQLAHLLLDRWYGTPVADLYFGDPGQYLAGDISDLMFGTEFAIDIDVMVRIPWKLKDYWRSLDKLDKRSVVCGSIETYDPYQEIVVS